MLRLAAERGWTVEVDDGAPFEVKVAPAAGQHFIGDVHERVFSAWDGETVADVWVCAFAELSAEVLEPCGERCEGW